MGTSGGVEWAELAKVDEFKYLGSMVQENGKCEREVKKRIQAGWSRWRKVSGIICDRKLSTRVKGKVYNTAVRPAMLYGMETVALTRRQEAELEVAELRMLRFAMGVTRLDKIKNTHVRGTANDSECSADWKESKGDQAEVVWACSAKECGVCRKAGDWHGFAREEEKRETSKEVYGRSEGRLEGGGSYGDRCRR